MRAVDGSAPSTGAEPRGRGFAAALEGWSGRLEALADRERDQLALWLPVGLGFGTAAWFALPDAHAWTAFLLAAAATLCGALAAAPERRWGRALALLALAAFLGCANVWWKAERVAAPRLGRERAARFDAEVESVQTLAARDAVRLVVRTAPEAGLPPRLRVNVPAAEAPPLRPGDAVRLRAWLMPPAPAAVPGAYDFSRAAWFQGVGGTGRVLDIATLPGGRGKGWSARIAGVRQRLGDHIASRLGGGEGAIAVALATGDQGRIPQADAEAMRRSGLAHLLSVSGLHLSAVVAAVMVLTLRLLALSPALALRLRLTLWAAGAAALAGIAYTVLTGAEVPTLRSCIASLLVLAGIAAGREALTLRLVAAGALVVLVFWPESLAGPSFQLSFAAITAIVALHDHPRVRALLAAREEAVPAKAGRFLFGLVLTGIVVEAALTPIALFHFHRAGLYGAAANIVAIPLTTFVVMPAEALALLLDTIGLGGPFWWAAGKALGLLLGLAHRTAAAPGAVTLLPAMPAGAFGLIVLGGLWVSLWRSPIRRWGAAAVAAGALWTLATPAPDILVTGDGRHVAVRGAAGDVGILRTRARDYVRDLLSESAGVDTGLPDLDDLDGSACNPDACAVTLPGDGRPWRLLAFRSKAHVEAEPLRRACAGADIVVAERRLPAACAPRWLKADAATLSRTGGLAIRLGRAPSVETVGESVGAHPWRAERGEGEKERGQGRGQLLFSTAAPGDRGGAEK
ncbi:MAG: ComEC/Rec2 family competence protein [Alphaproteobacteria bacterium]|nr:ComEC/Rec2 family competence protein [Alphaproteobacteria bacterium]MBV9372429.1 ComEC/Rec2 family competence protein [Alphaproteobacteria bacterium]MBV9899489.1 ComEC/Rec2 family competence protein [Alphaproteobacteria bacterium]